MEWHRSLLSNGSDCFNGTAFWGIGKLSASAVKLLQSCPTLCDPTDCSPPGSSVHGILQVGILGWVDISSSKGIFLTQGLNPHLSYIGRQIFFCWATREAQEFASKTQKIRSIDKRVCSISHWRKNIKQWRMETSLKVLVGLCWIFFPTAG